MQLTSANNNSYYIKQWNYLFWSHFLYCKQCNWNIWFSKGMTFILNTKENYYFHDKTVIDALSCQEPNFRNINILLCNVVTLIYTFNLKNIYMIHTTRNPSSLSSMCISLQLSLLTYSDNGRQIDTHTSSHWNIKTRTRPI